MKKILTLFAFVGLVVLQGCTTTDDVEYVDNDTISEVFELKNVNFAYNSEDGFNIYSKLEPQIYASDVVLIYRLAGAVNASTPIWQQIPRTLYFSNGREIDYDFDFSRQDFTIYVRANYDLELTPQYLDNQTFRIVIVPGSFSKTLNTNNYSEVIKALNINESKIQKINF
jgi:hypothetical protein